jgi:anion-transporting  ArsA/GET3 family ATPase
VAASLLDRALIYVTGKGGVGKSTVSAALGMAGARAGKRTIVCEVAEQDRMSRAFSREGVRQEQELQLADNLWATTISPQRALEEWLGRQVGGGLVKTLTRSSAFQYFIAAAPGAKELVTIAKVWETAQLERWDKRSRTYDLVIVDAPASGHGIAMLRTPQTFGDIARVGPVRRQSLKIRGMLSDPARVGYVAVALPEEMPVNETIELGDRLEEAVGLGLDAVIVNGLFPERFKVKEAELLRGLDSEPAVAAALAEHDRAHAQRAHLRRLRRSVDASVLTLPFLFDEHLGPEAWERLGSQLAPRL